jgi:trehalose 6-phosphate phosphatase
MRELMAWVKDSPRLWLFLNYEGVLEQFIPTRFDYYPNPAITNILEKLTAEPGIRTAILSGRKLEQLQHLIAVDGVFLAGNYGIEILSPFHGTIHRLDFEVIRPILEMVKPQWSRLLHGKRGFFLEDKAWRLAIHARFANEIDAERVFEEAQQIDGVALLSEYFQIHRKQNFLEIAPRLASKRQTIAYLLDAYPFEKARLLYIGNDDKEEDTIPFIYANNGIALKVLQSSHLHQSTNGDFSFHAPRETLEWLSKLV